MLLVTKGGEDLGFRSVQKCQRPVWVQKFLSEILLHLNWFPVSVREKTERLILEIAPDSRESRALFQIVARGEDIASVSFKTAIPARRLSAMKKDFFDRFLSDEIRKR